MKIRFVLILLLLTIPALFLPGCSVMDQLQTSSKSGTPHLEKSGDLTELSANYYYLSSRIHIKNKEYKQAAESLEKALAQDPDSFILTKDLIWLDMQENNKAKAMERVEELIRRSPDNVDGLLLRIQLKKNDISKKELIETLNKILKLDPESKETFLRLGRIYLEGKNYPEALILFQKMSRQFPDYYAPPFYLGQVYLTLKKYKSARKHFMRAIELKPTLVEPRLQIIKTFELQDEKKNRPKIRGVYREILEIEPENYRAMLGLALHYHRTGEKKKGADMLRKIGRKAGDEPRLIMVAVDEYLSGGNNSAGNNRDAVIIFTGMLKADPDNSNLNFFTGMAYESIKNPQKALHHYLKVDPDHPQYKKTILNIAFLYKELGENQTALNYLENRHNEFPKDIDIIIYLASFYEKEKAYGKSIETLNLGLKDEPENTSLLFRLGAVQDKAGQKNLSIATMEKLIEIDPKDVSALNYLGYTWADLGIKLDEALELIQRAHMLKPDDGYITDSLGWVYYKRGNFIKAVEYLKKAAELTGYESIISDHLGDAYQKINQPENAVNAYKKGLSNSTEDDKELKIELKKKIKALEKKQ